MLENTFLITFFINFDFTSLFLLIVFFFFVLQFCWVENRQSESLVYIEI